MNHAASLVPTTLDLEQEETLPRATGEQPDALATKVFQYTIVYVVLFITATVLLIA